MESKNSSLAILHEPFVAGMDENLSPIMQRLWKLEGGAIYFCRSGWAHVTIDLKDYEIVENTQIVLLPGTIIRINGNSASRLLDQVCSQWLFLQYPKTYALYCFFLRGNNICRLIGNLLLQ